MPGSSYHTRAVSPAQSDVSELTVFSRSPSPVPGYIVSPKQLVNEPAKQKQEKAISSPHRQPREDTTPRSTKMSPCKDTPKSKSKRILEESTPSKSHKRRTTTVESPTSWPTSPVPWAVGRGGFGTLGILPKEIRQVIYSHAFSIDNPVIPKACCGPEATQRERAACRKHGVSTTQGANRFSLLHVSSAVKDEASWVLFNQGYLLLQVDRTIAAYVTGYRSRSLRHTSGFAQHDRRKTAMWNTAAQFRRVHIRVPEAIARCGNPTVYTDHLLGIAALLCKTWAQPRAQSSTATHIAKSVTVDLGSIFRQMLPFNMNSQASARYGELLDWISMHSPSAEPDFEKMAAEAAHSLQWLVAVVGNYRGQSRWEIGARTQIDGRDGGGVEALRGLRKACARYGIEFKDKE